MYHDKCKNKSGTTLEKKNFADDIILWNQKRRIQYAAMAKLTVYP